MLPTPITKVGTLGQFQMLFSKQLESLSKLVSIRTKGVITGKQREWTPVVTKNTYV